MPLIAELEFIWIAAREPVALMPTDLYSKSVSRLTPKASDTPFNSAYDISD